MTIADKIITRADGVMLIGSRVPEHEARLALMRKITSTVSVTPSGCWEWNGWRNPEWRYGEVFYRGRNQSVHRLMWELCRGKIPEKLVIRHACDNPPCCNPEHLVLGTDADNVGDRMHRGRDHHSNLTECPKGHPYSGDNLYVDKRGYRHCKACARAKGQDPKYIEWRREYQRKRRAHKREQAKLLGQSRTSGE